MRIDLSLLVGLAIVLYILLAKYPSTPGTNQVNILLGTLVCALVAPLLCWTYFQAARVRRRIRLSELDRLERNSLIVWGAFGFLTWHIGWPCLLQQRLNLSRWILIDEVLLGLPLILSLVALLLVFEWNRQDLVGECNHFSPGNDESSEKPMSLWTWLRWELLAVLAPALLLFGVKDMIDIAAISYWQSAVLVALAFLFVLHSYPKLLVQIWDIRPLETEDETQFIGETVENSGVSSITVWQWKTGDSVANAAVLGVLPWGKKLVITERLLKDLDESSVRAIIRHELGHVKFRHLAWRLVHLLSPLLLCVAAIQFVKFANPALSSIVSEPPLWLSASIVAGFLMYLYLMLGWQSRLMEHEADLYAAELVPGRNGPKEASSATCASQAMIDLLRNLAQREPEMFDDGGWLHPSLVDRISLVERAKTHPRLITKIRMKLFWSKTVLMGLNASALVGILWLNLGT